MSDTTLNAKKFAARPDVKICLNVIIFLTEQSNPLEQFWGYRLWGQTCFAFNKPTTAQT